MSLQKKLDKAYNEGFIAGIQKSEEQKQEVWLDGIKVGASATTEAWLSALQNTKGIGPKLIERIRDQAEKEHQERQAERRRLIGQQEASA